MDWTPTWVQRLHFQREMRLEAFHKKNLVKAKKIIDDSFTNKLVLQVSYFKTPKMFWFLDQAIWREEHKSEYDFEKIVEGSEDPKCRDHAVILYKGLSHQRTTWSSKWIFVEVVMATLNGLPGSWDSFIWGMCARRKWLPSIDFEKKKKLDS